MCGRFTNTYTWAELHALYRLTGTPRSLPPRYNIAPTQYVPVVRRTPDGQRELVQMRWGLIPAWARDRQAGPGTINARAETVASKPEFREAYRQRRCIVPASGFLEWRKDAEAGNGGKQPFHFHRRDDRPLSLAALWERWSQGGETVESFAIIVTPANAVVSPIHDRMPAVLADGGIDRWLDPATAEVELAALLRPSDDDALTADRVHPRVNDASNDDPGCLTQVGDDKLGLSPLL